MKATKYLSLAALALMGTLASCQSDDDVTIARPANAVGINVTVGAMQTTRSNPASTDFDEAHLFNQGDQISVSTEGQDPVLFQCTSTDDQKWAEAVPGKFLLWTQSQMTFLAYYPATTGTSMTAFTLPADQSSADKIALADYMTREYGASNEYSNDINLDLERKTARVIVNIAGFTDQYDNNEKTVSNVRINSQYSTIDDGNGQGDVTAVTPYMQGTGGAGTSYTALVVPGGGDDYATFITLTDGESNTLTVKDIPELRDGYSYTYHLTVGKNTIQVQSVTVENWATGETLAGGQATESPASPFAGVTAEDLGKLIGADGKIYATKAAAETAGTTAVAKIAYLGSDAETSTTYNHGLALALSDISDKQYWCSQTSSTCLPTQYDDASAAKGDMAGLANTDALVGHGSHTHDAASAARNYNSGTHPTGTSAWFLPSAGQWDKMVTAAGGYNQLGLQSSTVSFYWSSSENNAGNAWFLRPYNGTWYGSAGPGKGGAYFVRACLAF